jgi:hypothetical protein
MGKRKRRKHRQHRLDQRLDFPRTGERLEDGRRTQQVAKVFGNRELGQFRGRRQFHWNYAPRQRRRSWINRAWLKDKIIEILALLFALYSAFFPRPAATVEVPRAPVEEQSIELSDDPASRWERPRGDPDPGIVAIQQVLTYHRYLLLSAGLVNADALQVTLPRLKTIENDYASSIFLRTYLEGARGLVTSMGPGISFENGDLWISRTASSAEPRGSFIHS